MLNERLAGGVVAYFIIVWQLQILCKRLYATSDVTQEVLIAELISEVETTGVSVLPLVDDVPGFRLYGERDTFVRGLGVARLMPDVFEDGDTSKVDGEKVDEVDTAEVVREHKEVAGYELLPKTWLAVSDVAQLF